MRDIFQDNKNLRIVSLEQEFTSTDMVDFPNASAYCQKLKGISDQLKNIWSPVTGSRLILQMVACLTEAYSEVGTLILQSNHIPPFYRTRSMLVLEEYGFAKKADTVDNSAMMAASF